jgi:hypothetical protein
MRDWSSQSASGEGKREQREEASKSRDCEELLLPLLRYGYDLVRRRRLMLWSLLDARPTAEEVPKQPAVSARTPLVASKQSLKERWDVLLAWLH